MENKKKRFYPQNFKINLKNLPPIDPSITTPAFSQVKYYEKPSWRIMEVGDDDGDACLCSTKHVDPNSTKSFHNNINTREIPRDIGDFHSKCEGTVKNKVSAKSQLHEVCAANHWNTPLFECCKEEGPCHMKLFTFKVTFVMEPSNTIVECFGTPQAKKKTAAEHAAEAALWFNILLLASMYNCTNPKSLVLYEGHKC
ncbi:hypothetical protein ACOSP7_021667 [Xanthoceras sorbifolium]